MLFAGENQMQESEQEDTVHKNVRKTIKLLTLSHMASEVLFTIWHGGQLATPVRTTLEKVKTILGADYTPAMP